jgi:cell division protein FtsL
MAFTSNPEDDHGCDARNAVDSLVEIITDLRNEVKDLEETLKAKISEIDDLQEEVKYLRDTAYEQVVLDDAERNLK